MELYNKIARLRAKLMFQGHKLTQSKEEIYRALIEMYENGEIENA